MQIVARGEEITMSRKMKIVFVCLVFIVTAIFYFAVESDIADEKVLSMFSVAAAICSLTLVLQSNQNDN